MKDTGLILLGLFASSYQFDVNLTPEGEYLTPAFDGPIIGADTNMR